MSDDHIHPNPEKLKAIIDAPPPKDVLQVQSYLGLLNHYRRFIPKISDIVHELYRLTQKGIIFKWSENCQ